MKWSEMNIHTTNEAVEPISNILHEAGVGGVVIEDPFDLTREKDAIFGEIYELDPKKFPEEGINLKAYLLNDQYLSEKIKEIKQSIFNLKDFDIDLGANKMTFSDVDEVDWSTAWKTYYKPVKISDNLTITPTWEEYTPSSLEEVVIELDPGMAFGTGTHPTTILSILALEKHLKKNDLVIDIGCGSGILSIASALLGARFVHAFDLDHVAVRSAMLNIELNDQSEYVEVKQNDLLKGINLKANIIVANILAEVIVKFIRDAWNNLRNKGLFITSGIILSKKEKVLTELKSVGFFILEIKEEDEWVCIIAKKV